MERRSSEVKRCALDRGWHAIVVPGGATRLSWFASSQVWVGPDAWNRIVSGRDGEIDLSPVGIIGIELSKPSELILKWYWE